MNTIAQAVLTFNSNFYTVKISAPLIAAVNKWICQIKIEELHLEPRPVYGCDSLQALTCAILFVAISLRKKGLPIAHEFVTLSTKGTSYPTLSSTVMPLDHRAAEIELLARSAGKSTPILFVVSRPYTEGQRWYCSYFMQTPSRNNVITFSSETSLGSLCEALRGLHNKLSTWDSNLYSKSRQGTLLKFDPELYFFPMPLVIYENSSKPGF
jgi:hypothetical protein